MAIKIKLEGFDDMLNDIEAAGGSIDKACISALSQSAQTMQSALKGAMNSSDLASDLANRMPPFQIEPSGNRFTAKVGFMETPYNPRNPSDYHKAVFANYGTPYRKRHGKESARGFVQKAKKAARPKIKKQQKAALTKILERLK